MHRIDAFRAEFGALNPNPSPGVSFPDGRREINWDGVPNGFAAPNNLPATFFNANSPRGAVFSGPGPGFHVSANAGVAPVEFGDINPGYPDEFAVFTDVDLDDSTRLDFFDAGGGLLFGTFVLPGTTSAGSLSFLGADLTPIGAEKAGNKDGTIPEWTGGLCAPPAGWTAGKGGYKDPFAGDKALFTITKANAAQYKDKLTPGTLAMLNKFASFSMPVYQTRRTACYPKEVYDIAKAEAGQIDLAGWGLSGRVRSTVPFPVPKNGLEAIWNHSLRYLGGGLYRLYNQFPVRSNGEFYKIESEEYRVFNQNLDSPQDNLLFAYLDRNLAPATLEGNTTLVHEPVDQVKQERAAWQYNSGSRRVRRAPELGYDNIGNASDGLRTFDQVDMYNGSPDRYDWKLVGKQEVFIPYNAYKLDDKSLKYKDIIQKNVMKSDLFRYELHRVWVVEATLRKGMKHVYAKRTFYLDEDTWQIAYEDTYDSRGDLWRVGIAPMMQFYDSKVPFYRANIWHDLTSGAYLISLLTNEINEPWTFGHKAKWADFQPDALRRAGTK